MTREEWFSMCFDVAQKHPEFLRTTFEAFSAGVEAQAEYNSAKVADMGAALSMLYQFPKKNKWRTLARTRLIESKLFLGTPFEKTLLAEGR